MVTQLSIALAVGTLVLMAEALHQRRLARLGWLLFGPKKHPNPWTKLAAPLRALAAGALAWGLMTLLYGVEPKQHGQEAKGPKEFRHLVLVLDVSPSMRLVDAGPDGEQSRLERARDVLNSMFARVAMGNYKVTVVATYSGAIPVVVDTTDAEVLQNVLGELPMHYAFKTGETRLFDGLEEAAKIAAPWKPGSTTILVMSDGDTLPPTGMPKMPASVAGALVIGVGDPVTGRFIGGRNSRQDASALRQMALRLGGTYHDGNKKHVATTVLKDVTSGGATGPGMRWTRREYALLACVGGGALLALIPVLLQLLGTAFRPGRRLGALQRDLGGRAA